MLLSQCCKLNVTVFPKNTCIYYSFSSQENVAVPYITGQCEKPQLLPYHSSQETQQKLQAQV